MAYCAHSEHHTIPGVGYCLFDAWQSRATEQINEIAPHFLCIVPAPELAGVKESSMKKNRGCFCPKKFQERFLDCFACFLSSVLPYVSIALLLWIAALVIFPTMRAIPKPFSCVTFIAKCLGGTLTLWVAAFNLKKFIDIETVRLLGDLRKRLNSDPKKMIHYHLLHQNDKDKAVLPEIDAQLSVGEHSAALSNVEIFDYLGTLELGAIMLYKKTITLDEFDNQFGYRINNVVNNSDLRSHIYDPENNYSYLIWGICEMKCHGLLRTDNSETQTNKNHETDRKNDEDLRAS